VEAHRFVRLEAPTFSRPVIFNLGYEYRRGYEKTSYINQNETQEPLEF
jgi:hypothetical protein